MAEKAQEILRLRALRGLSTEASTSTEGRDVKVLQDLYHAKMRVAKLLSKRHPDWKKATDDFTRVLGRVLSKVRRTQ